MFPAGFSFSLDNFFVFWYSRALFCPGTPCVQPIYSKPMVYPKIAEFWMAGDCGHPLWLVSPWFDVLDLMYLFHSWWAAFFCWFFLKQASFAILSAKPHKVRRFRRQWLPSSYYSRHRLSCTFNVFDENTNQYNGHGFDNHFRTGKLFPWSDFVVNLHVLQKYSRCGK